MAIGNSVNDEIREQRRKGLKQKGFKNKLSYYWDYYKVHTLVTILAAAAIISTIVSFATKKDTVLQVAYVNGFPTESCEEFMDGFADYIHLDTKKEEVLLDDSFYISTDNPSNYDEQNEQKLFIMSSAGSIDVCIADESYFKELAKQGYLLDLSTVLSPEQSARYQKDLFYYDSSENLTEGEQAVGIRVTDAPKLVSSQSFPNTECYYCIIMNSKHIDNALSFLEYLEE